MHNQPHHNRLQELIDWIEQTPNTERFEFSQPVRSVKEAIDASGFSKSEFIKSICLKHKKEDVFVVAIIPASSKVDKKLLLEGVNAKKWNMATSEEILKYTGFPAGGVPPIFLGDMIIKYVDPRVLKKEYVVGGGGTQQSLIRIPAQLIQNFGIVEKIVSFG